MNTYDAGRVSNEEQGESLPKKTFFPATTKREVIKIKDYLHVLLRFPKGVLDASPHLP